MPSLSESQLSKDMRSLGLASSAGSLVLTLLWVGCMIALSGEKTAALQLEAHPVLFHAPVGACDGHTCALRSGWTRPGPGRASSPECRG